MSARALALGISLLTAAVVVGGALWLFQPTPDPDVLPRPSQEETHEETVSAEFPPREVHAVTLSNGDRLFEVPVNCQPDDAGSLSCRDLCASDVDCRTGHLCGSDPDFGYRACLHPIYFCQEPRDCPQDQACLLVPPSASGVPLRRCFPIGTRKAGEKCDDYLRGGDRFCEAGLICNEQLCGAPCDVRRPSCSEGWECVPDARRVLGTCVPSCRDRPCPRGQFCRIHAGEVPVCFKAVGYDCFNLPCPEGHNCLGGFADERRETLASECRASCEGRSCPDGQVCDSRSGLCYRRCTRDAECTAPERCAPPHERASHKGCMLLVGGLPRQVGWDDDEPPGAQRPRSGAGGP